VAVERADAAGGLTDATEVWNEEAGVEGDTTCDGTDEGRGRRDGAVGLEDQFY